MTKDLLTLAAGLFTGLGLLQIVTSYPVLAAGVVLAAIAFTVKGTGNAKL
jgi:hypothetical protein